MESRSACHVLCSHGGICSLDVDHDGLHSASGYCEWERSDNEIFESDMEMITTTLDLLASKGRLIGEEE